MLAFFHFIHTNCRKRKKFLATNVSLLGCNFGERKKKTHTHTQNENCNARRLDFEV
jgi:hypothetical protein